MAEAADMAYPAQGSKLAPPSSDVIAARLQQVLELLFPSNLAAKAALFAVVVALLPLLPTSQAPARIWDLPHLLLLGIIISYGVFGQKNADAAASKSDDEPPPSVEDYVSEMMQGSFVAFGQKDRDGDDGEEVDGGFGGGGVQAWSSQYLPDDPLVVVADNVSSDGGKGDGSEKPLHLPVRKLKPADEVPATVGTGDIVSDDGIIEDEDEEFIGEFVAPKKGSYDVVLRERAIRSPSSVLDAGMTLSPSSPASPPLLPPPPPPPPPPFLDSGRRRLQKAQARSFNELGAGDRSIMSGRRSDNKQQQQFRSKSAVHTTRSGFASYYDPAASVGYEAVDDDDGELDDEVVAGASTDSSSFGSDDDMMLSDNDEREENSYGEDAEEDDGSCDEELFELATRAGPDADEVDRKAEEFIAKFRDQIRMQRVVGTTASARR